MKSRCSRHRRRVPKRRTRKIQRRNTRRRRSATTGATTHLILRVTTIGGVPDVDGARLKNLLSLRVGQSDQKSRRKLKMNAHLLTVRGTIVTVEIGTIIGMRDAAGAGVLESTAVMIETDITAVAQGPALPSKSAPSSRSKTLAQI